MNMKASGSGLNHRLVRIFGSSASLRDGLVLLVAAVLVIVLETYVDVLPTLADWARAHPAWQVDKLFMLLFILAIGFVAFAIRRMREIGVVARRRSEVEARFRDFVAMADEWFWEIDDQLRLTVVDDKAPPPLVDLARQQAPWQPDHLSVDDGAWARHRAELAGRKPFRGFRFHISGDAGTVHHIQISGKPFFDRDGRFCGYRGTGSDVTSAVTAQAASAHLARFDALTDLPNRSQLCDDVDHAAVQARQGGQAAALLCIDLDRFREINDTLGPAVGDRLLKACALRLHGCLGEHDRLARISGDEFAIVQGVRSQPDGAAQLARQILARFGEPFDLDSQDVIVSGSIGIALIDGEQSSDEVLERAGIALHRAKQDGRATFCLFEQGMEVPLRQRRALEWDLKRGLEEDAFRLVYQPQIDARTREITGLTAVVRWLHPDRGLLEAKDFIADADETGMSVPLGAWVLRAACADAVRWPQARIAVGLSPLQFRHRDLIDLVHRVLDETGLEPARLEIEIPEHALLADANAAATLERLRGLGVRLVLGNFGQASTRLAHRNAFVFDQVKVDRLFTGSLADRTNAQMAAHAMEAIAHGLGHEVCFEGIESADQETLITTAGCTALQGQHYGRAMEPGEIDAILQDGASEARPDSSVSAA
jgi:diguanylate cyclase (GGDEF)-like protein